MRGEKTGSISGGRFPSQISDKKGGGKGNFLHRREGDRRRREQKGETNTTKKGGEDKLFPELPRRRGGPRPPFFRVESRTHNRARNKELMEEDKGGTARKTKDIVVVWEMWGKRAENKTSSGKPRVANEIRLGSGVNKRVRQ